VEDTGIGIKKEDFSKVFECFERLDRKRRPDVMGTGLGLAITKNLLTLMGGSISFDSEYGRGSRFTVMIPLVPGVPGKDPGLEPRIPPPETQRIEAPGDAELNRKAALGLLKTLEPLLAAGNTVCLTYVPALQSCESNLEGKKPLLITQIQNFEFPAALETVFWFLKRHKKDTAVFSENNG
jgi:hypothetical protein